MDASQETPAFEGTDPAIDRTIEVIVAARIEMTATLRLLCASLGADVGLSLDEIDDLRLAVSEVFTSAVDAEGADRISVTLTPADGQVSAMFFALGPVAIELDGLATTILRSAVEDLVTDAGTVSFVKRSGEDVNS